MLASDAPPSLEQVLAGREAQNAEQQLQSKISELRLGALKAAAMQVGTQAGYQRRTWEIERTVRQQSTQLDQIYNFRGLMLESGVVPPVLVEGRDLVSREGDHALRLSDRTYEIVRQARFATSAPDWREYLIRGLPEAATVFKPDPVLAPRNDVEAKFWQEQVKEGWSVGAQQADMVFNAELARLQRDYKGMVLYRSLLYRNMVSKPFVAESKLGVTGDGNRIAINDRILKITATPQLELRSERWTAPLHPEALSPHPKSDLEASGTHTPESTRHER